MSRAPATRRRKNFASSTTRQLIREILALRHEEAELLGYRNFGEVSVVAKMADSPEQVITFLRDLAAKARPFAEKDLADCVPSPARNWSMADPQAWDWAYIAEKLKEERYAFSEQDVKQYFTAPKVLAGLFKIVETLFEVTIRRDVAPVWNVRAWSSTASSASARTGTASPPSWSASSTWTRPRATASAAAPGWTTCARAGCVPTTASCKPRWRTWCATSPAACDGKPPLLTHDDVITLFHECGHGLHHMLTQVNERDVSGISGVEWDAVELPSQFMENFCWEWDVLRHMTAHVDTGSRLPRELFDKMLAGKNFQSGLQTLRQIEFSLCSTCCCTPAMPGGRFHGPARQGSPGGGRHCSHRPSAARRNTFQHIFCGRLRGGLLQLQVGRGAVGRRLCRF
jgi:oligopeptidase A